MNHKKFVKLWNSSVSTQEIATAMKVTPNYVSKYAAMHRDECPARRARKVESNEPIPEKQVIEEVSTPDITEPQSDNEEDKEIPDTIVLDTSAIARDETFKIIEVAKHVVISSVVLREMNRLKDATEYNKEPKLHKKIQKVLKECAFDINSEKYSVVEFIALPKECPDETIVRNASKIDNAVVVTSDYGLCCFCKLYKTKYLLILDELDTIVFGAAVAPSLGQKKELPFNLVRHDDKLTIICLMGTIEVRHHNKSKILYPNEEADLFPGDRLTMNVKKESRYMVVKNKKHELILKPITSKSAIH